MSVPLLEKMGERLRALRHAKGYTLSQVASLAGVSPSFLSMLENGKTSVAADRLQAIAAVFGLNAGDLLPLTGSGSLHVVRTAERPAIRLGQDGVSAELLVRDLQRRIQPVVLHLSLGARHENLVGHAGEEFVFVLAGRVRLILGGDQQAVLEKGDSAYYPSSLSHVYENVGDCPAEILTVSTPPKTVP